MPCFCSLKLQGLSGSLPPPLPTIALPHGAVSVLAAASAAMNASASASASMALSATASAKLALLASVTASLKAMGMASLNANLALPLSSLINSLNVNAPTVPPPPTLGVLPSATAAGLLAAIMANLMKAWGINLAAPGGIAQLQAKLDAIAQARASATASASAAASASASAAASAALSAQAQASAFASMAASMGLPLAMPDPLAQLVALVNSLAAMKLPAVTMPPLSLNNLLGALAALANLQSGFGINPMGPFGASAIASAVARVDLNALANVNVSANLQANAAAAASASASANASLAANAAFGARIDGALAPLHLPSLEALVKALMAAVLMKLLGLLPTSPCEVCTFMR